MSEKYKSSNIYLPGNLPDLLSALKAHPEALIFNGGTALMAAQPQFIHLPVDVISISGIRELQRITRTERYMEVGCGVTISKILEVGRHILPKALYTALQLIGTPQIRNQATVIGNICTPGRIYNAYPVMLLLDVRAEIRRQGGSRWIPISRLYNPDGTLSISPGEFLSRIRVPYERWTSECYQILGSSALDGALIFCGLTRLQKEFINETRLIFLFQGQNLLRDKEIENFLNGKKVPLSGKDKKICLEYIQNSISSQEWPIDRFEKERVLLILRDYLSQLYPEE